MASRVTVKDLGWRSIKAGALGLNGRGVKVGILANAGAKDGTQIADYAAFNEFGTSSIPARPFLRQTWDTLTVRADPSCPVCGDDPSVTGLVDYEQFCAVPGAGSDGYAAGAGHDGAAGTGAAV